MVSELSQTIASGVTSGVMFGFVAVGFVVIFNSSDVINFAQGDFAMAGGAAYITLYGMTRSVVISAIGAVLIGALLGGAIYLGPIRVARRATVMRTLILTLGVSVFLEGALLVLIGAQPLGAPPLTVGESFFLAGAAVTPQLLWVLAVLVVASVALWWFFNRTMVGLQMVACAIDRRGAVLMGIDVSRMVLLSWTLAGALAALAGVMIAPLISVAYNGGLVIGINGFAAAALTGMGRIGGALIGGIVIGVANSVAAVALPQNLLGFQDVTGVVILLLVLMVRPSGLVGGRAEARHTAER